MVLAVAVEAPADAGPELGGLDRVGRPVVAFDPDDLPPGDINFEKAAPAAVVGRAARADHLFRGLREDRTGRGAEWGFTFRLPVFYLRPVPENNGRAGFSLADRAAKL